VKKFRGKRRRALAQLQQLLKRRSYSALGCIGSFGLEVTQLGRRKTRNNLLLLTGVMLKELKECLFMQMRHLRSKTV
jgi:hypothetical protein